MAVLFGYLAVFSTGDKKLRLQKLKIKFGRKTGRKKRWFSSLPSGRGLVRCLTASLMHYRTQGCPGAA